MLNGAGVDGVAEETAEVGNIVVVHMGSDFLYGEVGFSKVAFEFIDDRVIDEAPEERAAIW